MMAYLQLRAEWQSNPKSATTARAQTAEAAHAEQIRAAYAARGELVNV